jgi:hypothetical protein
MSDTLRIPVPSPTRRIMLRVHGENLLMSRSAWLGLADELAPDSELLARLRDRLTTDYAEEIRESAGIPWEHACRRAEWLREDRPSLFALPTPNRHDS